MPRFFIDSVGEETALILGEDAHHISRSLRMKTGETLTLCDQKGFDYNCEVLSFGEGEVTVKVLEKTPNKTEPAVEITLYQALPKGDKLELIVQKAVELGVSRIVPVMTSRCISRPKPSAMERKIQRLEKIALEAAKQSERGKIPEIGNLLSYKEALAEMAEKEKAILFYENETEPLRVLLNPIPKEVGLMVGSEGGFSPEEAQQAKEQGVALASLGTRILRCETAPLCGISAVLFAAGEF